VSHPNKTGRFFVSVVTAAALASLAGGAFLRHDNEREVQKDSIVPDTESDRSGEGVHGQTYNQFVRAGWIKQTRRTASATYYEITDKGREALKNYRAKARKREAATAAA